MKLYFSGLASGVEANMLERAGVEDYLADMQDSRNVPIHYGAFALDSGAYRAWKDGKPIADIMQWMDSLSRWYDTTKLGTPSFVVMPDILGDWEATWQRWQTLKAMHARVVPVWQWGAPEDHLRAMLAETLGTVCVGGLVPHFRAKDETVLGQVKSLCTRHGSRLHILGLNWLKAIEELMPLADSCDTSKWLDGGRYGDVIHIDETTGHLAQINYRNHPAFRAMEREERCIESARVMNDFVNRGIKASVPEKKYARTFVLNPGKVFVARNQRHEDTIHAHNLWQSTVFEIENEKRKELADARRE